MGSRLDDADYQLRWPRWLFAQECSRLLNQRARRDWDEACELLLEDAFVADVSGGPLSEFREVPAGSSDYDDPWASAPSSRSGTATSKLTNRQDFLRKLLGNAGRLREDASHRRPYWSQRKTGSPGAPAKRVSTVRQFVGLVRELDDRGYFEKRFGKDCVDDPSEVDPSAVIEHEIGVEGLWPLDVDRLDGDLDLWYDTVEVLHDLIARPETRTYHSYSGCGWHHSRFSIEAGRGVYRWRVNQLLERSDLGLQLADSGEDAGRLVAATDDARRDLLESMSSRGDGEVGDQIRHSVALFRAREADRHQKRSAVVVLANVLEERRRLIRDELLSKDEDALFMIANRFNVRHQNEAQQSDYDVVFLDWIFWWYLATIELTDRIAARR